VLSNATLRLIHIHVKNSNGSEENTTRNSKQGHSVHLELEFIKIKTNIEQGTRVCVLFINRILF